MPNKHSLITHTYRYTHPHQYPNRVLPNSSMYNSTLAPSPRCGRSHWLPFMVPCCAPLLPVLSQEQGNLGLHTVPQNPQVPRVPTRTARGNQECYTLHSYPASFPNICVQNVPSLQEAVVLGMQHPVNCSSPPAPKHQQTNGGGNKEYKGMATLFQHQKTSILT